MASEHLLYREFGLALASVRRKKHLSQAQLAGKVGLSRTSVTNIERGRHAVRLHQVYIFATTLGVEVATLLPKEAAAAPVASAHAAEDKKLQYIAKVERIAQRAGKRRLPQENGR